MARAARHQQALQTTARQSNVHATDTVVELAFLGGPFEALLRKSRALRLGCSFSRSNGSELGRTPLSPAKVLVLGERIVAAGARATEWPCRSPRSSKSRNIPQNHVGIEILEHSLKKRCSFNHIGVLFLT